MLLIRHFRLQSLRTITKCIAISLEIRVLMAQHTIITCIADYTAYKNDTNGAGVCSQIIVRIFYYLQ